FGDRRSLDAARAARVLPAHAPFRGLSVASWCDPPRARRSAAEAGRQRHPRARAVPGPPGAPRVQAHGKGTRPLPDHRRTARLGRAWQGRGARPADRARPPERWTPNGSDPHLSALRPTRDRARRHGAVRPGAAAVETIRRAVFTPPLLLLGGRRQSGALQVG